MASIDDATLNFFEKQEPKEIGASVMSASRYVPRARRRVQKKTCVEEEEEQEETRFSLFFRSGARTSEGHSRRLCRASL